MAQKEPLDQPSFTENAMTAETVIVSKCLLGYACQYDGTAATRRLEPWLIERLGCVVVAACPEELGGLPTPRNRMELVGGDGVDALAGRAHVMTNEGEDRTELMIQGAKATLDLAREHQATRMIAQRRSPSCSCSRIRDGSFSGGVRSGVGVTVALLQSEGGIRVSELDEIIVDLLKQTVDDALQIYRGNGTWTAKRDEVTSLLREVIPLSNPGDWDHVFRDAFHRMIPGFHESQGDCDGVYSWDSDTVRFFQESFRAAYAIELIDTTRRCRICTYPAGFLDCHLGADGICSACKVYQENKELLVAYPRLRKLLHAKLQEARGKSKREAVVACSGGKDSTYMLLRLCGHYQANVLCVMDDLEQQNDQAIENVRRAASHVGAELRRLAPPAETRNIRRNFLMAGNSFCRLCLRSHLIRVYAVAIQERIPLVFFGLTPNQCLDCTDAIQWSLNAIRDVSTPLAELDHASILRRYKHRAFQGGFDAGFVTREERKLYAQWEAFFDQASSDFAPLVVPFFLFDGYPGEDDIMKTISREVDWRKPDDVLLDRTNCRLLRLAGIMHRGIGRYHLNYKERATELRFQGVVHSDDEAQRLGTLLDRSTEEEAMSQDELVRLLEREFGLSFEQLPVDVQERLKGILE